ncbi:Maf family protein [Aliikangiella sp. IMCC44653]
MSEQNYNPPLVLASSSPYRSALLKRLMIPFQVCAPNIDETPLHEESPQAMVERLSVQKAVAALSLHPNALVLASDQAGVFEGRIIGKPHTLENARQQLAQFSGKQVEFITGVCATQRKPHKQAYLESRVSVKFRQLSKQTIENYLLAEKPFDCAGSFKVESLGISLFESVTSDDPTALEGLPLIATCKLLRLLGVNIP